MGQISESNLYSRRLSDDQLNFNPNDFNPHQKVRKSYPLYQREKIYNTEKSRLTSPILVEQSALETPSSQRVPLLGEFRTLGRNTNKRNRNIRHLSNYDENERPIDGSSGSGENYGSNTSIVSFMSTSSGCGVSNNTFRNHYQKNMAKTVERNFVNADTLRLENTTNEINTKKLHNTKSPTTLKYTANNLNGLNGAAYYQQNSYQHQQQQSLSNSNLSGETLNNPQKNNGGGVNLNQIYYDTMTTSLSISVPSSPAPIRSLTNTYTTRTIGGTKGRQKDFTIAV